MAGGRGKGDFFKTRFSGISPSGNGGPGGGGSQARMGSGSHRGERDGRCYTRKQCWDGEVGGAPAGVHLSRGKQPVWALESEPPQDAKGRRGAGTPRSAPAQIPALNHEPNNVTPQDAPIPLRAKPQHSSRATGSPQVTGSSQSMVPCPCSAPAPARSLSRHFSRAAPSLFGHFLTRDSGPWGQAGTARAGTALSAPLLLPEQKQLLLEGKENEEGGTARAQAVTGHCQPHWAH